ncbi:MAG: hypothetical protein HKN73_02160, partial [Gemmatimonadetes bacterium]|nr:hypothetical protein [Gemmatimonadota bacterium]
DEVEAATRAHLRPGMSLALLCVLFAFAGGFVAGDQAWLPQRYLVPVKDWIKTRLEMAAPPPRVTRETVSTGLLRLDLERIRVPGLREGAGGGLTSVRDHLLLVTHDGNVLRVDGTSTHPTSIRPPDNGFRAYRSASGTPRYENLNHNLLWFRYNDVLYFESDGSGALALSYTEWHDAAECYTTTVARLDLGPAPVDVVATNAGPEDWRILFRTEPCLPLKKTMRALEGQMAGGRMAYDPSTGLILLGSGDYHWDGLYAPDVLAQDPRNDYGKVLEIDPQTGASSHRSIGHRNVQGLALDTSGRLWGVEHGPRGGDELNLIRPGRNFGWPRVTLGTAYSGLPWPDASPYGRHDGYAEPVFAWVPSIATSNLVQVRGFDPAWDGDLMVASLRSGSLFRVRLAGDRVQVVEPIPLGEPIRYVHQHSDGRLVAWTDQHQIVFISKSHERAAAARAALLIKEQGLDPARAGALTSALGGCLECHGLAPSSTDAVPHLGQVFGGPVAGSSYPGHSPALEARGGRWTRAALTAFLSDPQAFAPGTTMPAPNLSSRTVNDLVSLLERLSHPE